MPRPRFSNGFDNKNLPLEEVLRRLEDDVDEWTGATLTVIPPLPTELSDEDSGDEDDNSTTINNLTGRFLRENVEVALKTRDQDEADEADEDDADDQLSDLSFHEPNSQTVRHEDGNLETVESNQEPENSFPKRTAEDADQAVFTAVRRSKRVRVTRVPTDADAEDSVPHSSVERQPIKIANTIKKVAQPSRGKQKRGKGKGKEAKKKDAKPELDWKFTEEDLSQKEADSIPYTAKSSPTSSHQLDPVGFFELFFDEELINLIVSETNKYALFKGAHQFSVTENEIKAFLTIMMLSSYVDVYSKDQYWSRDLDTRNELVASLMPRNRFREILRYLHVADNNAIDEEDRFFKVRKYLELIRQRCLEYYLRQNTLSVDETMVPYFGRHSLKQYIKGKPVKFGFKLWALASHDGYMANFIPYAGKSHQYDKVFGVGGSAVRELVDPLPAMDKDGRAIFIDNLFTSFELLSDMGSKGYAVTGTLRRNRTKQAPLKDIDGEERGTSTVHVGQKDDSEVCLVQWKDNKTVLVASNKFGVEPIAQATRYSKSEKKRVPVDCPNCIKLYNSGMGGVDLCDQVFSTYRVNIRKKAWWFKLFNHGLNIALNTIHTSTVKLSVKQLEKRTSTF